MKPENTKRNLSRTLTASGAAPAKIHRLSTTNAALQSGPIFFS